MGQIERAFNFMYKHIVFDVDGTLIDTASVCQKSLQRLVLSRTGRVISPQECDFAFGMTSENALPAFGLAPTKDILDEWNGYFNDIIDVEAKVFSGVSELLTELRRRGVKLGLLTSRCFSEMGIDPNLEGILHFFDEIVSADDTTEHKPKPEPMLLYLSRTGVRADEVLYIGDTVYDYQCATGAGVPFALAGWGALNADEVPPCYAPKTPGEVLLLL